MDGRMENRTPILHLAKAGAAKMEISAEKTKLMTNNDVEEQKLRTVTSFKYLGAIVSDEGSKP